MKINKLTAALIALGVVSVASANAQIVTNFVYLTGSTAARGNVYNAFTAGNVFGSAAAVISPGGSSGANLITYQGTIGTNNIVVNCSFTGSEAGIASVAGQGLTQNIGGTPYNLPGVPPSFLTQASGWTSTSLLPNGVYPDLTMADTSQAVSQTSKSTYPLTDYGIVGIVTFSWMKGYQANPDATWSNVVNVTTAQANQNFSSGYFYNANNYTGVASDASEGVAIDGRNKGSGTRANVLVNLQYGVNSTVNQYSYGAFYPSTNAGVLTFNGVYTPGQTLVPVGNDGYDGGSSVATSLEVDGSTNGVVVIGYLGLSDSKTAVTGTSGAGSGPAQYLSYNGVWESDANIINGSYSYWGQEHLLGSINQSLTSVAGVVATHIITGLAANLTATGAGTAIGDVRTELTHNQSTIIPPGLMKVYRISDGGFPIQGTFPTSTNSEGVITYVN